MTQEEFNNLRWEINKFEDFYRSAMSNKRKDLLMPHTLEEIETNWQTFKAKGYNFGFALERKGDEVWLHWLHNSEPSIKGIGKWLVEEAVRMGANHLFNINAPYLNELYESFGFIPYDDKTFKDVYTHVYRSTQIMSKPVLLAKLRRLREEDHSWIDALYSAAVNVMLWLDDNRYEDIARELAPILDMSNIEQKERLWKQRRKRHGE